MSTPKPVVKKNWPRWAIGPLGNRAIFQCAGDVPSKWRLETPLPGTEPPPQDNAHVAPGCEPFPEPVKNKGGRPPKAKA